MVKPWMLAYIDERMKEATQLYDKPFGGVAVLMFGDFDQQPPIGGSSLPHFCISLLEQEYQRKHKIFHTKQSRLEKVEMNSTLSWKGAQLFKSTSPQFTLPPPYIQMGLTIRDTWQTLTR